MKALIKIAKDDLLLRKNFGQNFAFKQISENKLGHNHINKVTARLRSTECIDNFGNIWEKKTLSTSCFPQWHASCNSRKKWTTRGKSACRFWSLIRLDLTEMSTSSSRFKNVIKQLFQARHYVHPLLYITSSLTRANGIIVECCHEHYFP